MQRSVKPQDARGGRIETTYKVSLLPFALCRFLLQVALHPALLLEDVWSRQIRVTTAALGARERLAALRAARCFRRTAHRDRLANRRPLALAAHFPFC